MSNSGDQNIHNNAPNYGNQGIFHVVPSQDNNIGNYIHRTYAQKVSIGRLAIKLKHIFVLFTTFALAPTIICATCMFLLLLNPISPPKTTETTLRPNQTPYIINITLSPFCFLLALILISIFFPWFMSFLTNLRKHRITTFLRIYFELGDDGVIYRTHIEGSCPKCKNKLHIRYSDSEHEMKIRCSRSHHHQWHFDNTFLKDVSLENIS